MYKQVIIIRKDLKWGKGKIAAHTAHASVGSMLLADQTVVEKWAKDGAKKVVLKIPDLKKLIEIHKKIKKEKIPSFLVRDAGLTQLKPGTVTALGIGPVDERKVNKITGKLKLL